VASLPFVPQLLPRLAAEAAAWQRVKYKTLKFTLVPQVGTASAGGYVLSFVKDSTDPIPEGEPGLRRLFSQDSAVSSPVWETATISVTGISDKYYTNWDAASPRWSSPGQICIMTEGKPSVGGAMTLYCEYDVTFYAADIAEPAPIGVGEVIKVNITSTSATPHLSMQAGTRNLSLDGKEQPDWKKIFPGAKWGDVLRLPSPRYYLKNEKNVVAGLRQVFYITLTKDKYCVPCEANAEKFDSVTYGDVPIIINGEELILSSREADKDFVNRGWKLLCHPCPDVIRGLCTEHSSPNREWELLGHY